MQEAGAVVQLDPGLEAPEPLHPAPLLAIMVQYGQAGLDETLADDTEPKGADLELLPGTCRRQRTTGFVVAGEYEDFVAPVPSQ